MDPVEPIDTLGLFPGERAALLELLADLDADAWAAPTACPGWSVHDVALHLLGDDVGRLSRGRDGHPNPEFGAPGLDLASFAGLVAAIDRQNDLWVRAMRRVSPPLLIDLLRLTGERTLAYFRGLDLEAVGGPVDWASPEPAPVWLDVAREYTERWVHQQHIRDAAGRPGLTERRWLAPVLDAFARGLPRALAGADAPPGTRVTLAVTGGAGGTWTAVRGAARWDLFVGRPTAPDAAVDLDQDIAWRLFTKGVTPEEAERRATLTGDLGLARRVLRTVSILA